MKCIRRYPIPIVHGAVEIAMPAGAEHLHTGLEAGDPAMWFLVDPAAPTVDREFFIARADFELPAWCSRRTWVASLQVKWDYRWILAHVFEHTLA